MTGVQEYELKYQNRINAILDNNPNLRGFYSFMQSVSITTAYTYLNNVAAFLKYIKKETNKLNVDDFSRYLTKIKRNKKGELSTSSYRIEVYSSLKKFGKYLVACNKLESNPMELIERPKFTESQKTISKREIGFLTQDEIKLYMQKVESGVGTCISKARQLNWKNRDKAIIILFLTTGIRCSALVKIDMNDIDFEHNILQVTDKEDKVNKYEISSYVMDILLEWINDRKIFLEENYTTQKALFISNQKNRITQKSVSRIVNKYASDINGKHITPHKLRATYGTQLYNKTRDIYFVQKCMNHNSPQTTERYIRGGEDVTKRAFNIMESVIQI